MYDNRVNGCVHAGKMQNASKLIEAMRTVGAKKKVARHFLCFLKKNVGQKNAINDSVNKDTLDT